MVGKKSSGPDCVKTNVNKTSSFRVGSVLIIPYSLFSLRLSNEIKAIVNEVVNNCVSRRLSGKKQNGI